MTTLSAASIILWSVKSTRRNAKTDAKSLSVFDGPRAHDKYHHGNLLDGIEWMTGVAPYRLFYLSAWTRNGLFIKLPIRYSIEQAINDLWRLMDIIGADDTMPGSLAAVHDDQEIRRCIRAYYARQYAQGRMKA